MFRRFDLDRPPAFRQFGGPADRWLPPASWSGRCCARDTRWIRVMLDVAAEADLMTRSPDGVTIAVDCENTRRSVKPAELFGAMRDVDRVLEFVTD